MFFLTAILAVLFTGSLGRKIYRVRRGYRYAQIATRLLEASPRQRGR